MNDLRIRQATVADADVIYKFVFELNGRQFDKATFRQCYEACLDVPNHYYLVAAINDKPVGYISCHGQVLLHHCGLVYEIQELFVVPEYRSKGVGKRLLTTLEQRISGDNYVLLEVASNQKRKDAHRFYEANGFECTTYKFKKVP